MASSSATHVNRFVQTFLPKLPRSSIQHFWLPTVTLVAVTLASSSSMYADYNKLKAHNVTADLPAIREDMTNLRADISKMKADMTKFRADMTQLHRDMEEARKVMREQQYMLEGRLQDLESQQTDGRTTKWYCYFPDPEEDETR